MTGSPAWSASVHRGLALRREGQELPRAFLEPDRVRTPRPGRGPPLDAPAEFPLRLARLRGVHRPRPHPDRLDPAIRTCGDRAPVHRAGVQRPGALPELLRRPERLPAVGRTREVEVPLALQRVSPHHVERAVRGEGRRRMAAFADALLGRAVDEGVGLPGPAAVLRAGPVDLGPLVPKVEPGAEDLPVRPRGHPVETFPGGALRRNSLGSVRPRSSRHRSIARRGRPRPAPCPSPRRSP